jgi:hypothetical protein
MVSPSDAVDDSDASDPSDTVVGATADHATAEGAEVDPSSSLGSRSTLQEMLMSTEPSRPLDSIESPWDPEQGGPRRVLRAAQKMTGVDGLPAWLDLLVGALETVVLLDDGDDNDRDENVVLDPEGGDAAV